MLLMQVIDSVLVIVRQGLLAVQAMADTAYVKAPGMVCLHEGEDPHVTLELESHPYVWLKSKRPNNSNNSSLTRVPGILKNFVF